MTLFSKTNGLPEHPGTALELIGPTTEESELLRVTRFQVGPILFESKEEANDFVPVYDHLVQARSWLPNTNDVYEGSIFHELQDVEGFRGHLIAAISLCNRWFPDAERAADLLVADPHDKVAHNLLVHNLDNSVNYLIQNMAERLKRLHPNGEESGLLRTAERIADVLRDVLSERELIKSPS